MTPAPGRKLGRLARRAALAGLLAAAAGCQSRTAAPAPVAATIEAADTGPGEVELSAAAARFEPPNVVRFEVKYRFTKGKPDKYYSLQVSFPGTENKGIRMMDGWELKSEGVIKDGFVLQNPPAKTFEAKLSEAASPQNGYKPVSNVVSGPVE